MIEAYIGHIKNEAYAGANKIDAWGGVLELSAAEGKVKTEAWVSERVVLGKSLIKYGRLYTWAVAADPRGVGPDGYHIASDTEWANMTTYMSQYYNLAPDDFGVGNHLKSKKQIGSPHGGGWDTPEHPRWDAHTEYGRDTVGFSALPGGVRRSDGVFVQLGVWSWHWCGDQYSAQRGWMRIMMNSFPGVFRNHYAKSQGMSLRSVRDATPGEMAQGDGAIIERVTDYDGNRYEGVLVADKIWTVQPLASKKYKNGDDIPHVTDQGAWGSLGDGDDAWCNYNNDEHNAVVV